MLYQKILYKAKNFTIIPLFKEKFCQEHETSPKDFSSDQIPMFFLQDIGPNHLKIEKTIFKNFANFTKIILFSEFINSRNLNTDGLE